VAYLPAPPAGALVQALGEMANREFSLTTLIGGKLRALYGEAEQPCPSRLDELLRALDEAAEPRLSDALPPPRVARRPQLLDRLPKPTLGSAGNL
jgi:hypothetical protein